jgi:hypothetical protein
VAPEVGAGAGAVSTVSLLVARAALAGGTAPAMPLMILRFGKNRVSESSVLLAESTVLCDAFVDVAACAGESVGGDCFLFGTERGVEVAELV